MTEPPSSKAEVEPAIVIPITLNDFEGEDRKSMEEYIKELTQEALMRASTRTRQGVIIKPWPRPKLAPNLVSNEEVTQSIQQQVASTIDSSMTVFKDRLDATFEDKFDEFLRFKVGPLLADFVGKNKASTTASQAPIDQTNSRTDGVAHTAGPTGPDGRSDRDFTVGPTGQTAGPTGTFDPPVSTAATNPQVPPHVPNAYNDVGRGYPPDTRQVQYNHIAPQTQPIRPPNPPPNQHRPDNMEEIIGGIIRDKFGIETRNRAKVYQKPYPDYYDNMPFPRNYRVPKYTKFSGEDGRTTWEHESRVKDNKKIVRPYEKKPNVNVIDYPEASDSEDEGDHDMYVAEWSWTNKNKPFVCSNLMPTPRKDRQSEVQLAIDEGRLKFTDGSKMKLDHDPFPRIIGEASTSKAPRKTKVTLDMLLEKYEKQGSERARNKGKIQRSPPRERFGHSPRRSHSPPYHHSQDIPWGPYPMPPPGYPYPYYMPWGATLPMFNHMPPMQFNQGWGGPRRPIHERLSSPNNGRFYGKNRANEESHTAGLTGPSGRSDRRPDNGPTDASGRFDRPSNIHLTGASGWSDRWSTSGLTRLQRRFDRRFAKGDVRASSSSTRPNRGHYLPPGTEPKPRRMPKYLTATQRRRLQCLRAQEIREKKAEEQRDKRFNELRPPPVWRRKTMEKEEPVVVEKKEEQSVAKDESSPKEDMDINKVCMLPMEFCAMDEAEVAQFSLGPKDVVFEKPDESNRHMKPLYLKCHIDGKPVSRMLLDGGAAVNLMPYSLFKKLGRGDDELKKTNMILNGFNGEPTEAKGIFSEELTVGNKTLPTAFFIVDVQEANLEWLQKRVQEYRSTKNDIGETIEDFDEVEKLGQGFTSADPLEEVDIVDGTKPRPTFVNKNMRADYKVNIIELLKEYVDCFAWEYHEMPGLSRELVEHRLPIKPGFRPYKQPPRRFNPLLYDRVKEEIDRLLKAGFIGPCRYAEWVSCIVLVEKKGSGVTSRFLCLLICLILKKNQSHSCLFA
uniref:Putative polyprotein n=1 Tax=Oryza sativa subsp. japonica TaxID=39947 RepID=Q6UUL5_ORYSJ|nr:putative polyprotein [Oryza sativa Japonica Group]